MNMYPQPDHPLATRRNALVGGLALAAALACATTAHAQGAAADAAWPTKPVRLISPYPVGGGPDGVARLLADKLSRKWGKPVVVAANAQAPYANVAALLRAAKDKPGSISFASPGNGSTPHMALELFERTAGIQLQHVPYRGGSPAITDVIGGQVPLIAVNALEVQPHVKSGKLRVLAVLSPTRSAIVPDAPTMAESGFPGFEASVWYGLVAPAATPKAVVTKLHAEVQKALQTKEVRERMTQVGGEVIPGSSDMFAALIRAERQRYEKLVREANIQPD